MLDPAPRTRIPDEWAPRSRCPVCGAAPMQIQHEPSLPDCMGCSQCGTAFLVEQGGSRIYFIDLPAALVEYGERWMTFGEASKLVQQMPAQPTPAPVQPSEASQPPLPDEVTGIAMVELETRLQAFSAPPAAAEPAPVETQALEAPTLQPDVTVQGTESGDLSPEELWEKALKLYSLGNSLQRIAAILNAGGSVDPEQLGKVQAGLEKLEQEKLARQKHSLKIAGGVVLGLLLCILAVAAVSFLLRGN